MWFKTVTHLQCFLQHPDKSPLLEEVLFLLLGHAKGAWLGCDLGSSLPKQDQTLPQQTATGDVHSFITSRTHRMHPIPISPLLATHQRAPYHQKRDPTTFIPLAFVALSARGSNSQDPADGVG